MTTCWNCGSLVELHKDRVEKKHPFPNNSFWCEICKDAVLLCNGCDDTTTEWFYSSDELWEDIEVIGGKVYCPGCWQNDPEIYSKMEKACKNRENMFLENLLFGALLNGSHKSSKKKRKVEDIPKEDNKKPDFWKKRITEVISQPDFPLSGYEEIYDTVCDVVDKEKKGKVCRCGEEATTKQVKKEGKNKGKMFWSCPKPMDDKERCNFFEWRK